MPDFEDRQLQNFDYGLTVEESKDQRRFKKDPALNVISKEDFEDRIEKVFYLLWEALSKSFGPYGAPTLICNYPYKHVTKDGYTIMKNLSMDASETMTDQSIADLASDICGRLNYTVGDGTTSAIIATNSIYKAYLKHKDTLQKYYVLPRDVIRIYEALKNAIIEQLQKEVRPIRSLNTEELAENIREVVYISSNGDEEITKYITDFYRLLGNPAITCSVAPDGITKAKTIDGYQYELCLNDKKYANTDEDTMELMDADVIIFSVKISKMIYDHILKPLNFECKSRGRHLIVCAPTYDEKTLIQTIANDLNNERRSTGDINMVLTTYKAFSAHHRRLLGDFAMLMNTVVIDRTLAESMIEKLTANEHISRVINIDDRKIVGIKCAAMSRQKDKVVSYRYGTEEEEQLAVHDMVPFNDPGIFPLFEDAIRLGFVHTATLGMKTSIFSNFEYDEDEYKIFVKDAETILEETERKYARLGTFNIETSQAQQRLYALRLKMGMIEVGGTSEMSQGMLKDAVDDSVRAAVSAFNHGVILGCNTTLIRVIYRSLHNTLQVMKEDPDGGTRDHHISKILLSILFDGFFDVYRTVLSNAFDDDEIPLMEIPSDINATHTDTSTAATMAERIYALLDKRFGYVVAREEWKEQLTEKDIANAIVLLNETEHPITLHGILIAASVIKNKVFDVSNLLFSETVINSAQTDEEVLTATIDLMGLLIAGNQMVITAKHNF